MVQKQNGCECNAGTSRSFSFEDFQKLLTSLAVGISNSSVGIGEVGCMGWIPDWGCRWGAGIPNALQQEVEAWNRSSSVHGFNKGF